MMSQAEKFREVSYFPSDSVSRQYWQGAMSTQTRGFKVSLLAIMLLLAPLDRAKALIIDIDSRTNGSGSPVVVYFSAGEYDVTPIGKAADGVYNAWQTNAYAEDTWVNAYTLSSDEFSPRLIWDFKYYATDLLALASAQSTLLRLTSSGNVNFYIRDPCEYFCDYSNNNGGISLKVTVHGGTPPPSCTISGQVTRTLDIGSGSYAYIKTSIVSPIYYYTYTTDSNLRAALRVCKTSGEWCTVQAGASSCPTSGTGRYMGVTTIVVQNQ